MHISMLQLTVCSYYTHTKIQIRAHSVFKHNSIVVRMLKANFSFKNKNLNVLRVSTNIVIILVKPLLFVPDPLQRKSLRQQSFNQAFLSSQQLWTPCWFQSSSFVDSSQRRWLTNPLGFAWGWTFTTSVGIELSGIWGGNAKSWFPKDVANALRCQSQVKL